MRNIREPSRQQKAGTGYLNYALASALFLGSVFAAKNALSSETKNNAEGGSNSISKRLGGPGNKNAKKTEKATSKPERICDTTFVLYMDNEFKAETFDGKRILKDVVSSPDDGGNNGHRFFRKYHREMLGPEERVVLLAHTYLGDLNRNFLGLQDTQLSKLRYDGATYGEATVDIRKLRLLVDAANESNPNFEFSCIAHSFDGSFTYEQGFLSESYSGPELEQTLIEILHSRRLPTYEEMWKLFHSENCDSKIYLFFDKFVAILNSKGRTEKINYLGRFSRTRKLLEIVVVSKKPFRAHSTSISPKSTESSQSGSSSEKSSSGSLKDETEDHGASSQVRTRNDAMSQTFEQFRQPQDVPHCALASNVSDDTTTRKAASPRGRSTTSTGQQLQDSSFGPLDFSGTSEVSPNSNKLDAHAKTVIHDDKSLETSTYSTVKMTTVDGQLITEFEDLELEGTLNLPNESRKPKETGGQYCDTPPRTENSQSSTNASSPSNTSMSCDPSSENSGAVKDQKMSESSEVTNADSSVQMVVLRDDESGVEHTIRCEEEDDFVLVTMEEA